MAPLNICMHACMSVVLSVLMVVMLYPTGGQAMHSSLSKCKCVFFYMLWVSKRGKKKLNENKTMAKLLKNEIVLLFFSLFRDYMENGLVVVGFIIATTAVSSSLWEREFLEFDWLTACQGLPDFAPTSHYYILFRAGFFSSSARNAKCAKTYQALEIRLTMCFTMLLYAWHDSWLRSYVSNTKPNESTTTTTKNGQQASSWGWRW